MRKALAIRFVQSLVRSLRSNLADHDLSQRPRFTPTVSKLREPGPQLGRDGVDLEPLHLATLSYLGRAIDTYSSIERRFHDRQREGIVDAEFVGLSTRMLREQADLMRQRIDEPSRMASPSEPNPPLWAWDLRAAAALYDSLASKIEGHADDASRR